MGHTLDNAIWRKSSYSGSNGGDCVEVADNLPGHRRRARFQGPARAEPDVQPRRVAGVHHLRQAR